MDIHQNDSAYIDDTSLLLFSENCSKRFRSNGKVSPKLLRRQLLSNLKKLINYNSNLTKNCNGKNLPTMSEWLMDNIWLINREGLDAALSLNNVYKLPSCDKTPCIFLLCSCLLDSGDGSLTEERCRLFLEGWQRYQMLTCRELNLFVPMLKVSVIVQLLNLYENYFLNGTDSSSKVSKLFSTLSLLSSFDFKDVLEQVNKSEQLLIKDPLEIYPQMSDKTKAEYRNRVEKLAKQNGISEFRVVEKALQLARSSQGNMRHVGYWLFVQPLGIKKRHRKGTAYISIFLILSIALAVSIGITFNSFLAGLLSLLPLSQLVKSIMDSLLIKFTPPRHIPRLDLQKGVPYEGRTLLVISSIINSIDKIDYLTRRLEEFRCASTCEGENLLFGILADFKDSPFASSPEEEELTKYARSEINKLNRKYGGGFYYFTRDRVYNKRDKIYMGWERKRGAITELIRLIYGRVSNIKCASGSSLGLSGVKYLITLDEDTRLIPGAAGELIGAMLHPLNKAVIDEKHRIVKSGYGIIHPRISTELSSCNKNYFTEIFAGHGGADPYGSDSSELYMDIFDCGSFAGKGIINIEAFEKCMDNRLPENRVLSHDALEGAYLRGGFMGDVELLDSFPENLLSHFKRMHRWTRGDWQNYPWIFKWGHKLSGMDRFRLFDNLRRSLMPLAYVLSFACSFFSDNFGVKVVALLSIAAMTFNIYTCAIHSLFRRKGEFILRCASKCIRGVNESLTLSIYSILFLPYESYVSLSAIITSLWRVLVSKSHVLDWTPASLCDSMEDTLWKYYLSMFPCELLGIAVLFSPSIMGKCVGLLWLLAPLFAFELTKSGNSEKHLSSEDKAYLLRRCKNIWSFFCDFCRSQDNFLPPDNFQEQPSVGIAHRTSPTNIGLCLLSCITAIDLGIAAKEQALSLIASILSTLRKMPRYLGHFYNWYDTKTLNPILPAYISTVDSGNLAICLMILKESLLELDEKFLVKYCDELLAPMSFTPLYNKKRRLFFTSIDAQTGKASKSVYDLMASEARTAGFVAIIRGDVPKNHWQHLSRAMVASDGFRGMVSWTGTMFEYMMPRLFFKSQRGSLMYESMKFCCHVQKNRPTKNTPWGISESLYYSLNPDLSYKYKAHGCGALSLKRGMDSELVISPYSSFLALPCTPKAAISNLRRLENLGVGCKYGFYEAVDFTKSRDSDGKGKVIKCVMAHHLGMSLIAAGNLLCGDIMCARLMRNPSFAAYSCMLDEKLPLNSILLRNQPEHLTPKSLYSKSAFLDKNINNSEGKIKGITVSEADN